MALCVRLKYQHFVVAEIVVTRCYHLLARLEAFEDFVELRVLTADADFTLHSLSSLRRDNVDPLSSCLLIECAARNQDGLLRLAELKVQVVSLTCADICRLLSVEPEVCLELTLTYLRIYLSDDRLESLVLTLEPCLQTC